MRWFTESERQYRCIGEDSESAFLNWKDERGESGTASLVARVRTACSKMNIRLKLKNNEMILTTPESEHKTKTAVGIGRFLTQGIIRTGKITKLIAHGVRGASFTTLKNNEVSNRMLTNVYTRRSDSFFRFVVVGRADSLPTPANLQLWFGNRQGEACRRCALNRRPTLAHILNGCTMNFGLYTVRHNQLANVVRKAVIQHVAADLRSGISLGIAAEEEGIPERLKVLKPDMVFRRRNVEKHRRMARGDRGGEREEIEEASENMMEILEFTCPSAHISYGEDTLEMRYREKQQKSAELANELSRVRHEPVRVTAIVVSSMGAVYDPSLKALQKVLRCSDRALQKLGHQMSETVILGSLRIWRAHTQEVAAARREAEESASVEEANAMMDEEVSRLPIAEVEAELHAMEEENDDDSEYESNGEQEREMGEKERSVKKQPKWMHLKKEESSKRNP
jgi:hypothetical protein